MSILHSEKFVYNAKLNVLNAFATFIILAYCKTSYMNFALLSSTQLYESNGSPFPPSGTQYFLYNASRCHTPEKSINLISSWPLLYTLGLQYLSNGSSTFVSKVTQLLPPNALGLPSHSLIAFKAVTKREPTKLMDYGYFAGFYLLIRLITHISKLSDWSYSIVIQSTLFLTVSILFGVLQPCKNDFYNRLDCMFFGLLTLGSVCILCIIRLLVILYFLGMITVL